MAVEQKADELKAQLLECKKRASDLQGEVDKFAKERKSNQDNEAALEQEKGKLKAAKAANAELKKALASLESEASGSAKSLDKAQAKVAAANKIKEGLAELG